MTYRERLFETYDRHVSRTEPGEAERGAWFQRYAAAYTPHLPRGRILEIGCSRGYLLAALADAGFDDLTGIDLSSADVEVARRIAPMARVELADATTFIGPREWDAIVLKAVLEHVPKDGVVPFVELIAAGIRADGVAIVDVPNMDWLFAGHERYMDFTHEVGFTQESLRQVLELAFADVEVHPVDNSTVMESRKRRVARPIARRILGTLISLSDPEGGSGPIWARSLVAVARGPRLRSTR